MKTDKPQIVIFEEEKDIITVWEDFFSENYNLSFANINTYINSKNIKFNDDSVYICSSNINIELFDKIKNYNVLFLINNNREIKMFKDQGFFIKPVYLEDLAPVIKKTYYMNRSSGYEKINIKNHILFSFEKKLISLDTNETVLLTEKEVSILIELNRRERTTKKEKLLTEVWGYNSQINTSTIETHIHRLRKKLKKFSKSSLKIKTIKGGYSIF